MCGSSRRIAFFLYLSVSRSCLCNNCKKKYTNLYDKSVTAENTKPVKFRLFFCSFVGAYFSKGELQLFNLIIIKSALETITKTEINRIRQNEIFSLRSAECSYQCLHLQLACGGCCRCKVSQIQSILLESHFTCEG